MGALLDSANGGYLGALAQSVVALVGILALAVVVLRFAAARGLGRAPKGARLEVVERMPLDASSALCVVRIGEREILVGTAVGQPPRLVAELGRGGSFREKLAELGADEGKTA